jgi:hypothetical protein
MYMPVLKIVTHDDVDTFKKKQPEYETVIAGFFMVNCPACKAFKPEWNKFINSCKKDEKNSKVLITEVPHNFSSEIDFDTSQLDGFPTVFGKHKDETPKMFKGDRTQDSLKKFLKMLVEKNQSGGKKRRRRRKTRRRKTRRRKTRRRKTRRRKKRRRRK